ncbi:MAG TPA: hypothetical protein VLD37_05615 [Candidatus Bilamarchaeum sp.]|nr:hypothetical protein [Candidatus Bilamarchaeum sp.]
MLQRSASTDLRPVRPGFGPPLDSLSLARGIAHSPKGLLKDYLKERKSPGRYSERDVLDAMDKLKHSPGDKEAEDILYALSDIAPSEGVRRKARDMIAERHPK